ncbi:hypothetical protein [Pediococcus parvulus]|uniref:hypothetical protein n=1 Tax=Pediococcus parvulus TaxID=54062 RepID=UPI00345ED5BA
MDKVKINIKKIFEELRDVTIIAPHSDELLSSLVSSRRIFADGNGRSGIIIQLFSNRLMQLGKDVHVIGEITCPAVKK